MNLARFTVKRPVFTTMAVLIVMILGVVALLRLPVDLMPDITYPTLSVSTTYENASPEEIEELVTRPLEEALSAVPGVEEITSTSTEGRSNLRVTFAWGTDLDVAANDVRDRLDRVLGRLPDDVNRPMLRKFDLAAFPVLILGASSDLDPIRMRRLIEDQVKFRVERIPGVALMDIWGGLEREIHVDLDLERVRAYDLSLNQVLARIRQSNVDRPAGTTRQGHLDIRVRVPGYFNSIDELRETVIMERDGVPVLLSDVAEVRDAWEKPTRLVRVNGQPGLRLSVNKQSGANTVAVAREVLAEIERINRDLTQISIVPIIDSSSYIQRSIRNLGTAAVCGGLLAVLVLLFFLHDLRSTLVVAAAIPVSVIAAFAMIYFNGYTLNIMTLGGLALGVGMLVDSAIVVLENIARLRADGREPAAAAVEGAEEVTSAIIASTLTTMVVFLPMIFVEGMAGVMFRQLAMVVGFSLLCSLIVAVTLVPMLASRWLRTESAGVSSGHPGIMARAGAWSAGLMTRAETSYRRILLAALNHKTVVVGCAVLMLAGAFMLTPMIGTELMPETDEGEVRIEGEMEPGTRLAVLEKTFLEVEDIVRRAVPEIENMVVSLGGSHWRSAGGHIGQIRLNLVPAAQRRRTSAVIADALRPKLAHVPGVVLRPRAGQGIFVMRMAAPGGERVSVEIRGHDFDTANRLAQQVQQVVENIDGVTDARISREAGVAEQRVLIDRRKAADLGLTVDAIAQTLETALGGSSAGYFREAGNEYRILVQSTTAEELPLDQLLDLIIVNRHGVPVVLRNVVRVQSDTGPVIIERRNQERVISVSANISGRDMGSIIADIDRELRNIAVPEDFSVAYIGDYEEQQQAFRELLLSLLLAVILVYMVMACQFESLRDPLVVMFAVPMASVGVILILLATGTTFNLQSFIGCIMLAGIVVNNAILLVDHTNLLRRRDGMELRAAIAEAGRRRLRPIMMTAMTTTLGLTPLAIGMGEGGEAQAPMARAVIGGLITATFITLLLVPVVYFIFEKHNNPQILRKTRIFAAVCGCVFGVMALRSEWVVAADAPEPASLNLTLAEAVLLALEHNPAFQVERLHPAVSRTWTREERAAFDPRLTAELSRTGTDADANTDIVSGISSNLDETAVTWQGGLGLEQALPIGANIALTAEQSALRTDFTPDPGTAYDDSKDATRYGITITQPLLRGFGPAVNLARLRQARLDERISVYELRGAAEMLTAQVELVGWEYVLAQRRLEIYAESLQLAERQRDEVSERILVGALPDIELAAAEAEVAQRRENLINARSMVARRQLELLRLIGPASRAGGWSQPVEIMDQPFVPEDNPGDIEMHAQTALLNRPELNEARLRLDRGDLDVVRTRNGLLPRLDFFVTLGHTDYSDSFGAARRDVDRRENFIKAGLRMEYPPFTRAERAGHNRAVLRREQAEYALRNLEDLIQVEVRAAMLEVQRSAEQIEATSATRRHREEAMRAENEKFRVGKSTTILVAQVQRDLIASRIAAVEAVIAHLKARLELYRLEGTLLQRRGLDMDMVAANGNM